MSAIWVGIFLLYAALPKSKINVQELVSGVLTKCDGHVMFDRQDPFRMFSKHGCEIMSCPEVSLTSTASLHHGYRRKFLL